MPSTLRPEDKLLELFLSAYEDSAWKEASLDWIDKRLDNTVEVIAERADGKKLAIEHTIVEPFSGEKADFAKFQKGFKAILEDTALQVPDKIIRVFVPVGVLDGRKPKAVESIAAGLHEWLKANVRLLEP